MGEIFLSAVVQVIVPAIATAVGTFLILLTRNVSKYLQKKSDSDNVDKYIGLLESAVVDVVQGLNQTTVGHLKTASADGKLTSEEMRLIKYEARDSVRNILGVDGMNALRTVFADLDTLISNKIERAVLESKQPVEQGLPVPITEEI